MIQIDAVFVDSAAPNAAAIKNGRACAAKKIATLCINSEKDILFGEIKGSGAENYQGSADFLDPAKPVYRCSCPSHQFPCKHVLGLLYAYTSGMTPKVSEIPESLAAKRVKAAARVEKKQEIAKDPEAPIKAKKVDKNALAKKLQVQLDGLEKLERLLHDIIRTGFGSMSAKTLDTLDQLSRQLADAYLPGARNGLRALRAAFYDENSRAMRSASAQEKVYSDALDQVMRLQFLCNKGKAYLQARLADAELQPETDTPIAALLGHAWQLSELKTAGCITGPVELLQLAFTSYDDHARQEFVDEGIWIELGSGAIRRTLTYRPYKAAKHIRSDDSEVKIQQIAELCVYPGEQTPRVRWDAATAREVTTADRKKGLQYAAVDIAGVVKTVKDQLRQPLAEREPVALVRFASLGKIEEQLVLVDGGKGNLRLSDCGINDTPSCMLLESLPPSLLQNGALLLRFHLDLDAKILMAQPLSLITADHIIRFTL